MNTNFVICWYPSVANYNGVLGVHGMEHGGGGRNSLKRRMYHRLWIIL